MLIWTVYSRLKLYVRFFRVLFGEEDKNRHFLHNNDFEARSALRGSRDLLSCVRK